MRKVMNGLVVAILAVPALVIGQAGDVKRLAELPRAGAFRRAAALAAP